MRCDRCGYSSAENHKFCGMCGAKLSQAAGSVVIDDKDPLDIETPEREPLQFRELERRREFARDAARSSGPNGRTNYSSARVAHLQPDTVQEEVAEEVRDRKSATQATGIGGPSFLGLGYEDTNRGFIYDKPKDDGFVYDTDSETPEYLLTEVSRGISWRAWAFFLLLIVGGGLGYVQWRASHNQGPDIAAILSLNGATVDPSGPDMTKKPASLKPPAAPSDSSATNAPKSDSDQETSPEPESSKTPTAPENSTTSKESAEAKNASATGKTPKTDKSAKSDEDTADKNSSNNKSAKVAAAKASDEDSDEAAKPESDGPVAKATKANRIPPQPVEEEAPKTKPLGEKDPLIVQANKHLRAKNCSAAVNLLRQASSAGNPSADVKMGALYWSGTCVTQSNVTAYQWFARAHSLEPNNRWIERSRSSLWANLSPAERRRVGY